VWLVLVVIAVALTIFTIVDVILTDRGRVRGVPKLVWVLVAVIPVVGAALWFLVGRAPATATPSVQRSYSAPDDDVAFLRDLSAKEDQDERIRRLERELAELDDEPPADDQK
jgi:hypothetical protein